MAEKQEQKTKRNISSVTREGIRADLDNPQILENIRKEFPKSKSTDTSINWHRNKLRQAGEKVKTAREAAKGLPASELKTRAAKKDAAPAASAKEDNPFDA